MFPEPHNLLGRSGRNALVAALFVVGAIAMYGWVVSPHVAYLQAVERLGPAVDHIAAEDDRIHRRLGPDLRRLQSLRQERADVQEGLFTEAEFATFLRNLPALVEETGCTVVVADFTGGSDPGARQAAGPDAAFTTRHAGLTVRGTLDQITALLDRLHRNRPRVWVDAFRMERVAAPPDPARPDTTGPTAGPDVESFPVPAAALFKCQLTIAVYTPAEPTPARPGKNGGPVP